MPRTPDEFPGIGIQEGILFTDEDGYGLPGSIGEIRRSDGYLYAYDQRGVFNLRHPDNLPISPHVDTHLGNGNDSFYVISTNTPTVNEDINDGYNVGFRWINTTDGYEFVLTDNTSGAAIWKNTTLSGSGSQHAPTHIRNGVDEIDADKLNITFIPTCYMPDISPPEVDNAEELSAHLSGIDGYLCELGSKFGAICCGQVLYSADGVNFSPELPLTSDDGWLINDYGLLLVRG